MTEMLLALAVFAIATALSGPALLNLYSLAQRQFTSAAERDERNTAAALLDLMARTIPATQLSLQPQDNAPHLVMVRPAGDGRQAIIWSRYGEEIRRVVFDRSDIDLRMRTGANEGSASLAIHSSDWSVERRLLVDLPERCRFSNTASNCLAEGAI